MADWFSENKEKIGAVVLFIALVVGVILFVPAIVDDKDKPQLVNQATGQKVYQQKLNAQFVLMFIGAGLVAFLILFGMKTEEKLARIRTLPEVWDSIPKSELLKWGLKDIYGIHFTEKTTMVPLSDPNNYLIRLPHDADSGHKYVVLDMAEDYLKRRLSPLISVSDEPMGFTKASSFMHRQRSDVSRLVDQAQKFGIKPEDIRKMIAERDLQNENTRFPTNRQNEGDGYG